MGQEALATVPPHAAVPSPPQPPAITIPPVPSQTYLHHTTLAPRPKLILIGDSITEQGSAHANGWVTSLAIRYNRRLDVLNRGMNGYNSRWGKAALPLILEDIMGPSAASMMPGKGESSDSNEAAEVTTKDGTGEEESSRPKKQQKTNLRSSNSDEECPNNEETSESSDTIENPKLPIYPQYTFLVGYGANDSALPHGAHSRHHVPIEEYVSNLKSMIQMIQSWNNRATNQCSTSSSENAIVAVALSTPPPCDTTIQEKSRHNENVTKLYAEACVQLAREMNISIVDLWNGIQLPITKHTAKEDEQQQRSSFREKEQWKIDFLSDGLHLTPLGNYRLYELVVEVLDRPMLSVENDEKVEKKDEEEPLGLGLSVKNLPRAYPDHSLVNDENPGKTFGTIAEK